MPRQQRIELHSILVESARNRATAEEARAREAQRVQCHTIAVVIRVR